MSTSIPKISTTHNDGTSTNMTLFSECQKSIHFLDCCDNLTGVIFDFNGTLFFDTPFHEQAWREYAEKLCGRAITDEEFRDSVHGRTNAEILAYFLGGELSREEIDLHSEAKEKLYRTLCVQNTDKFHLAEGAEQFMDRLRVRGVPMAIATSSGRSNSEFYMDSFNMGRWFDWNTFVYNDGSIRSKPHPDIYLRAAAAIGLTPDECAVFEDMPSGIASAHAAGAGKIIAVASSLSPEYLISLDGVNRVISSYKNLMYD